MSTSNTFDDALEEAVGQLIRDRDAASIDPASAAAVDARYAEGIAKLGSHCLSDFVAQIGSPNVFNVFSNCLSVSLLLLF